VYVYNFLWPVRERCLVLNSIMSLGMDLFVVWKLVQVAFGCVCCHHVPAVSLAELLTAGMFVSKRLPAADLISRL
jgi:hypothetical protein